MFLLNFKVANITARPNNNTLEKAVSAISIINP